MSKEKPIVKAIAAAMISVAVANLGLVAQAQRSTFLLRGKCVNSGLGNASLDDTNVSIGRQVYTSLFYLAPGNQSASITCRILSGKKSQPRFQTLDLGFGISDNDVTAPSVTVNIYSDGRRVESQTVAPSQTRSLQLDVSNVSNVSIETVCPSSSQLQYCGRVYFFQASLEPKVASARQNQK
jgi:hypothetical protein